jgi:hypothetical protein
MKLWQILAMAFALLAPLLGAYLWWRLLSSKTGERYMKQHTQGPWAPVDNKEQSNE